MLDNIIYIIYNIYILYIGINQDIKEDYERGCPRSRKVRRLSHYDVIESESNFTFILQFFKLFVLYNNK